MAAMKETRSKAKSTLRLQYFRSAIGSPPKHRLIIKGLGFGRLNQVVERDDTPSVRGMVAHVPHLVKILDSKQGKKP